LFSWGKKHSGGTGVEIKGFKNVYDGGALQDLAGRMKAQNRQTSK